MSTKKAKYSVEQVTDIELLLRALRCGAMSFYAPTGEIRFQGILVSTFGSNDLAAWCSVLRYFGRDDVLKAVEDKERGR